MAAPWITPAFAAGEITPALYGRVDLQKFHVAASTMRNMFVSYRGGAYSRAGTRFVARSKQGSGNPPWGSGAPPRLIPFRFSLQQSFCLEFGAGYMRLHVDGAPVVEAPIAITAVANTDPCMVTAPGNPYFDLDWVFIDGLVGAGELNGGTYIVGNVGGGGAGTFDLFDLNGNPVDATGFSFYASGGASFRVYTLSTPYADWDLGLLKYTQSADVMSIVHPLYPPYDLARFSDTNWALTKVTLAAAIAPPAACSAVATTQPNSGLTPPTLPAAYAFCVTAVDAVTGEESIASPIANVTNSVDIAVTAGSLIISWFAVAGAISYNIYKAPTSYNTAPGNTTNAEPVPAGAPFGYIGTAFGTQFVDSNIVADFQQAPPLHRNPFATGQIIKAQITAPGAGYTFATVGIVSLTGTGFVGIAVVQAGAVVAVIIQNAGGGYSPIDTMAIAGDGAGAAGVITVGPQSGTYPGMVSYYQERRAYASSLNNPDTYWMSQPGAFLNFDSSIPVNDADAITGTPFSQQVNGIQFMITMPGGLVTLTGDSGWQITASGGSAINPVAITPANQQAQPVSFHGCNASVPPITVDWDILFVESKGYTVRDIAYNLVFNFYTGLDLTQLSNHLVLNHTIREWAWCREPRKLIWAVRDDGVLLSLTYLKEQEVYGWARHDTFGLVESVASVAEAPVDALYLAVGRGPSSGFAWYIERMDNRLWRSADEVWCVDCAVELPYAAPDTGLRANTASGPVTFTASGGAPFSGSSVGQVLRMAGGIATITANFSPLQVGGVWNKPARLGVSEGQPNILIFANPGEWTIAPQFSHVGGLQHLVGLTVTGVADGIKIAPQVVPPSGIITLPQTSSKAVVGLPFTAQLQSVYAEPGNQPTAQGRRKDITAATVRIEASLGIKAGTNQKDGGAQSPPAIEVTWSPLTPLKNQGITYTTSGGATATELFTGDERVNLYAAWRKPGQVALQQDDPFPMNILALIPEELPGDVPETGYAEQAPQQHQAGQPQRGPGLWMLGR